MSDVFQWCCWHMVRRYADVDITSVQERMRTSKRTETSYVSGIAPLPSVEGVGQGAIVSKSRFTVQGFIADSEALIYRFDEDGKELWNVGTSEIVLATTAAEFATITHTTNTIETRTVRWRSVVDGSQLRSATIASTLPITAVDADASLNVAVVGDDTDNSNMSYVRYITSDGTTVWTRDLADGDTNGHLPTASSGNDVCILSDGVAVGGGVVFGTTAVGASPLILLDKSDGTSIESSPHDGTGWGGTPSDSATNVLRVDGTDSDDIYAAYKKPGFFGGNDVGHGSILAPTWHVASTSAKELVYDGTDGAIVIPPGPATDPSRLDIARYDSAGEAWAIPWRTDPDPPDPDCPAMQQWPIALAVDDLGRLWIGGEVSED